MAKDNRITLYDLQLKGGQTISPFVWATKYAIAHKGFEIDIVPGGFTGITERTGGKTERLPAIVDDGKWVLDSWLIAQYLDETYPDRPTLVGGKQVEIATKFLESWLWSTVLREWMPNIVRDYRDMVMDVDWDYITKTRTPPGKTLEETQAGREDRLPLIPPKLELLRTALRDTPWLGGDTPNYTDYRALAVFLFMAAVATTPVLTDDDPIRDWVERGFDLYGGLGRHPGMHPIFGLKLRDGDPEPFAKEVVGNGLTKRNTGPDSTRAETERFRQRIKESTPA
ncbi:MAG TPA: beta-etherase [Caulobacteraceae bacterium]